VQNVNIESVSARVATAKSSVTTPGGLTQEEEDDLWCTVIERIAQGN
jgi:hypothetical protein